MPVKLHLHSMAVDEIGVVDAEPNMLISEVKRRVRQCVAVRPGESVSVILSDRLLGSQMDALSVAELGVTDGSTLTVVTSALTASTDNTAKLWDVATGACTQ